MLQKIIVYNVILSAFPAVFKISIHPLANISKNKTPGDKTKSYDIPMVLSLNGLEFTQSKLHIYQFCTQIHQKQWSLSKHYRDAIIVVLANKKLENLYSNW